MSVTEVHLSFRRPRLPGLSRSKISSAWERKLILIREMPVRLVPRTTYINRAEDCGSPFEFFQELVDRIRQRSGEQ